MTDENLENEVKKLTSEDVPELAENEAVPESGGYCRFFKQTWTGWEETACSSSYSTEDDCARGARYAGADAYSWTGRSC